MQFDFGAEAFRICLNQSIFRGTLLIGQVQDYIAADGPPGTGPEGSFDLVTV